MLGQGRRVEGGHEPVSEAEFAADILDLAIAGQGDERGADLDAEDDRVEPRRDDQLGRGERTEVEPGGRGESQGLQRDPVVRPPFVQGQGPGAGLAEDPAQAPPVDPLAAEVPRDRHEHAPTRAGLPIEGDAEGQIRERLDAPGARQGLGARRVAGMEELGVLQQVGGRLAVGVEVLDADPEHAEAGPEPRVPPPDRADQPHPPADPEPAPADDDPVLLAEQVEGDRVAPEIQEGDRMGLEEMADRVAQPVVAGVEPVVPAEGEDPEAVHEIRCPPICARVTGTRHETGWRLTRSIQSSSLTNIEFLIILLFKKCG